MTSSEDALCFRCGRPVSDPPRIEQIEDGRDCETCRERMLASQPPIFHAPFGDASTTPEPGPRRID